AVCDARPLLNKDGSIEAFVPVVTLSLLCMNSPNAPNPEFVFTLSDGELDETIAKLEEAKLSLQQLRENLEGRSGYNWISLKEAGNDDEG
ncbi:MAG: hypothetical protein JJU11_13605, partial [Candidatus Sumerlaeia bacterium]|nr:hypothetical protein [Candidatus Sumerlaeia bacterium]